MKLYHLFPDLMNLYGDYGNLLVLKDALARCGVEGEIVPVSPGDAPDPAPGDLLYMGPGTEPARDKALEHLRPMLPILRSALERHIPMLFTGNSWLTLGHGLTTGRGQVLEGLALAEFTAVETDSRYTGDAIAQCVEESLPHDPVVGFQNRCDQVRGVTAPLFSMIMGQGNCPEEPGEGLHAGSLLCTHLTGPLLVKNPHLLAYLTLLLGGQPSGQPDAHAQAAYQVTLDALQARLSR